MGQSADYWLSRAEEARAIAGQMKDADARDTLLRIAERYEALAKRASGSQPGTGLMAGQPAPDEFVHRKLARDSLT